MDIGTWIMIFLVLGILIWIVLSMFTICEEEVGIVVSNHNATAIPRTRIGFFNLYWNFSGPFIHVERAPRQNKVDEIEIKHHTQDGTPATVRISIKFTFTPEAFATVYNVEHNFSEEILKRFVRNQIRDVVRPIIIGRTWDNINEYPEDFQRIIEDGIPAVGGVGGVPQIKGIITILTGQNFINPEITKVAAVFSANIQDWIKGDKEARDIVRKFAIEGVRVPQQADLADAQARRQVANFEIILKGLQGRDKDAINSALSVLRAYRGDKEDKDNKDEKKDKKKGS